MAGLQFLFHLANESGVFLQQPAILRADHGADLAQIFLQVVENALEILLILGPAV